MHASLSLRVHLFLFAFRQKGRDHLVRASAYMRACATLGAEVYGDGVRSHMKSSALLFSQLLRVRLARQRSF